MDPNQALANARDAHQRAERFYQKFDDAARLAALEEIDKAFEALDEWISKGGFLPDEWRKS